MFTAEDILARMRKQPFVPVRIVTSSGESYEVHHPDLVLVGRRDIQVGLASKRNPAIYEQVSRVSLLHITAMEDVLSKGKKSGGNGAKR